jgi:hypothetical protein
MVRAGPVSARTALAQCPFPGSALPWKAFSDPAQSKRAQCLCASGSVHGGEPGWSGQTRTSRHGRSVCPQRQCCLPAHGTTSVREIIPQPPSRGKTWSGAVRTGCQTRHLERQRSDLSLVKRCWLPLAELGIGVPDGTRNGRRMAPARPAEPITGQPSSPRSGNPSCGCDRTSLTVG